VQEIARRTLDILALAVVVGLAACSTHTQRASATKPAATTTVRETKPAPATPLDTKKIELGGKTWNPQWDMIVEDALPPSMLSHTVPRDVRRFCPRFYVMSDADKRAFWAYFFQALAGAEAGLNPTTHVYHTESAVNVQDEVTHDAVRSEGLMQLTYEDAVRYGCNFDWETDRKLRPGNPDRTILQPKNNLDCGVRILSQQIIDNHEPLFTHRSYWSTLQPGTVSYRIFAKQMTNPPLACGLQRHIQYAPPHHTAER
jgi:hypothetical protein